MLLRLRQINQTATTKEKP